MHQLAIYRLIDVLATFSSAEDPTDADREAELEINKLRLQLYDYYTGLKSFTTSQNELIALDLKKSNTIIMAPRRDYYSLTPEIVCRFPDYDWNWRLMGDIHWKWPVSFFQERCDFYRHGGGGFEKTHGDAVANHLEQTIERVTEKQEYYGDFVARNREKELYYQQEYERIRKELALEDYVRNNAISREMLESVKETLYGREDAV